MLEVAELRIGSNYNLEGVCIKLDGGLLALYLQNELAFPLQPIPLTEEILLRLGFELKDGLFVFENENYIIDLMFYDIWYFNYKEKDGYGITDIYLVGYWDLHEFQNLNYYLTKQELTLKP